MWEKYHDIFYLLLILMKNTDMHIYNVLYKWSGKILGLKAKF